MIALAKMQYLIRRTIIIHETTLGYIGIRRYITHQSLCYRADTVFRENTPNFERKCDQAPGWVTPRDVTRVELVLSTDR